jgi:hypothetical protein
MNPIHTLQPFPNSVVVFDNLPYCNVKLNKVPNSDTIKTRMKEWLQQETIPCSDDMLKPTLYALVIWATANSWDTS